MKNTNTVYHTDFSSARVVDGCFFLEKRYNREMSKNRKKRSSRYGEGTIFQINDVNQGDWRSVLSTETETTSPPNRSRRSSPDSPTALPVRGDTQSKRPRKHVGSAPGEKEPLGLRIIGGRLRGSKLLYAGNNRVRPMKDRVREALFNLLGPGVVGKYAIDLFAGTGALAIEAVSRGAVGATLIEMHFPTARNARQNLRAFDLESICSLIVTDAFYWSHLREGLPEEPAWLIFCSPPYDFFVERLTDMLEMLERLHTAAPGGSLIVIEADERFDFSRLPFPVMEKRRRSYPPAEIAIAVVE